MSADFCHAEFVFDGGSASVTMGRDGVVLEVERTDSTQVLHLTTEEAVALYDALTTVLEGEC